jgi:hypothetical protein
MSFVIGKVKQPKPIITVMKKPTMMDTIQKQTTKLSTIVQSNHTIIISSIMGVLCIMILFQIKIGFCTMLVQLVYPSYKTITSIQQGNQLQWLSYWFLVSCIQVLELVFFLRYIIPQYHILRILLLFWLFLPNTMGATVVYKRFLEPLIKSNKPPATQS